MAARSFRPLVFTLALALPVTATSASEGVDDGAAKLDGEGPTAPPRVPDESQARAEKEALEAVLGEELEADLQDFLSVPDPAATFSAHYRSVLEDRRTLGQILTGGGGVLLAVGGFAALFATTSSSPSVSQPVVPVGARGVLAANATRQDAAESNVLVQLGVVASLVIGAGLLGVGIPVWVSAENDLAEVNALAPVRVPTEASPESAW